MLVDLPAHWLNWSLGGGLCVVFLWLISVRPACDCVADAIEE
jgi:hypothetical protein